MVKPTSQKKTCENGHETIVIIDNNKNINKEETGQSTAMQGLLVAKPRSRGFRHMCVWINTTITVRLCATSAAHRREGGTTRFVVQAELWGEARTFFHAQQCASLGLSAGTHGERIGIPERRVPPDLGIVRLGARPACPSLEMRRVVPEVDGKSRRQQWLGEGSEKTAAVEPVHQEGQVEATSRILNHPPAIGGGEPLLPPKDPSGTPANPLTCPQLVPFFCKRCSLLLLEAGGVSRERL